MTDPKETATYKQAETGAVTIELHNGWAGNKSHFLKKYIEENGLPQNTAVALAFEDMTPQFKLGNSTFYLLSEYDVFVSALDRAKEAAKRAAKRVRRNPVSRAELDKVLERLDALEELLTASTVGVTVIDEYGNAEENTEKKSRFKMMRGL